MPIAVPQPPAPKILTPEGTFSSPDGAAVVALVVVLPPCVVVFVVVVTGCALFYKGKTKGYCQKYIHQKKNSATVFFYVQFIVIFAF